MRNFYASVISWSSVVLVTSACFTNNPKVIVFSVFLAAILDMFDGKVARKFGDDTKYTKIFGEATDSLCDIINFGFVPSVILSIILYDFNVLLLLSCNLFILTSLFRLARFSCLKNEGVTDYMGIPITVAGPLLSLVSLCENQLLFVMTMLVLSVLMVSKIKIKKLNLGEK